MNRIVGLVAATVSLAVLLPPTAVSAQRSDAEWLEDCEDRGWDEDEVYCEVRTVDVEASGHLRVDGGRNGGALVEGSAGSGVSATARIKVWGDSRAEARRDAEDVRINTSNGVLSADGPGGHRWSVTFHVTVPSRYDLTLEAHNGPVGVHGVSGDIELSTRNGPVSVSDAGGSVRARTQNGPVVIELSGSQWAGEGLDAETRNGPIRLEIPDGFNADLETGTRNGPMRTDIPLTVTFEGSFGGSRSRHLRTELGAGGPSIRAVTTNGPVVIERR
ncbi:MAG: hypothetical protein ABFS34_12855 [Gemmatimonadota bacterium]